MLNAIKRGENHHENWISTKTCPIGASIIQAYRSLWEFENGSAARKSQIFVTLACRKSTHAVIRSRETFDRAVYIHARLGDNVKNRFPSILEWCTNFWVIATITSILSLFLSRHRVYSSVRVCVDGRAPSYVYRRRGVCVEQIIYTYKLKDKHDGGSGGGRGEKQILTNKNHIPRSFRHTRAHYTDLVSISTDLLLVYVFL